MILSDELGWIANFTLVVGALYIIKKSTWGFIFQIMGCILYLVVGLLIGLSSVTWMEAGFIFMNLYGIYKWRKDAYKET